MGEPENLDFHDSWIWGPLGAVICGFGHTKLFGKSKNTQNHFWEIVFPQNEVSGFEIMECGNL